MTSRARVNVVCFQQECQINQLQLNSSEVAAQLTLRDFQLFQRIEATEYIDELFDLDSQAAHPNLERFSRLVNQEMFWVVSEVVREPSIFKRVKLMKHYIKVARHCKETKNFNSMFAIVSGLGHQAVSRLRQTWDRLGTKHVKMFEVRLLLNLRMSYLYETEDNMSY